MATTGINGKEEPFLAALPVVIKIISAENPEGWGLKPIPLGFLKES